MKTSFKNVGKSRDHDKPLLAADKNARRSHDTQARGKKDTFFGERASRQYADKSFLSAATEYKQALRDVQQAKQKMVQEDLDDQAAEEAYASSMGRKM